MSVVNLNPPTFHAWMSDAACAEYPGDIWFADKGDNHAAARAIAICRDCPVINQCATAGANELHGIWAGLTPAQRSRRRNAA